MVLNLIAFTVIFSIFGIIIFSQVQRTVFSDTDQELLGFREKMESNRKETMPPFGEGNFNSPPPEARHRGELNPRIMILSWNKDMEMINQDQISTLFYENYLGDYQPDVKTIDTITSITINENYHFRYLLYEDTNENDEIVYTQLLINFDAEQNILDNFGKLLIICSTIFIVLSISASYLLSKRMMAPIIQSWNKQAEFVENASHELRTPLTIIQNKLELLLTAPQEKIINKFENIALSLSETRRLSKLTSDLLTLARADSAETQLVKQSIELDPFVQKVCAPYIEIAESQDKHFWLNLNAKIPIKADDIRLHQLLVILLDNALKYTLEQDSIGVRTYVEAQTVVLEVSDTGIGIKEENLENVFERFYREDKARSRDTGGTGLGLSIAQWIVQQHNGSISVSRNKQKGTIFSVKIPM